MQPLQTEAISLFYCRHPEPLPAAAGCFGVLAFVFAD